MTASVGGALLVLLGIAVYCGGWIAGKRQELRQIYALAAALERMEGAVRWQQLSMDRILERESAGDCGRWFGAIKEHMGSGFALQAAWENTFSTMEFGIADILCRVELQGDAKQIMGSLCLAAEQLRRLAAETESRQGQRERLCVAAGTSLGGLLIILLI